VLLKFLAVMLAILAVHQNALLVLLAAKVYVNLALSAIHVIPADNICIAKIGSSLELPRFVDQA
jgi:hypothetical protein